MIALVACAATRGPMIGDTDVHAELIASLRQSGESVKHITNECRKCHKPSSETAPRIPMRDLFTDRRNCLKCHK